MIICDKEEAAVNSLHFKEIPDCPEIISKVKVTGWSDTTYDDSHGNKN